MAVCEQCGSIRIVRARPEPMDRVVRLFTSKRPFLCRRCGWQGRRGWTDADLLALTNYGAGGAESDPALAVLDGPAESKPEKLRRGRAVARSSRNGKPEAEKFDMGPFNLAAAPANQPPDFETPGVPSRASPRVRPRSRRRRRSRRREIVATVAVTALVLFTVVMLGLTGSCTGAGDAL